MAAAAAEAATSMAAGLAVGSLQAYTAFFQKPWKLQRKIRPRTLMLMPSSESNEDSLIAECEGTASLNLHCEEATIWTRRQLLLYEETGNMVTAAMPDRINSFSKTYFYELSADTGALELKIYFDVSREGADLSHEDLFCTFNLSKATVGGDPVPSSEHLCQDDRYLGELFLEDKSTWTLRYQVMGPNKDYIIETHFKELDPSTEAKYDDLFDD